MMKLSIVVPVYNVEKYLNRCVDSLLKQNLQESEYEIILIDDESEDTSGQIAEQYAEKYNNITVIHQKNKGLSGARNTGLRASTGEYVLFVDSDDWLIENTVQNLLNIAMRNKLDVGVADFKEVYEDGRIVENTIKPIRCRGVMTGDQYFLEGMKKGSSLKCVWKSIYRRDFLIENDLYFREGYNHEDEEWTPRLYLKANRILSIDLVFYCYFIRSNSISKSPESFAKNSYDLISNCYELKKLSCSIENKELRNYFQDNIVGLFLSAFYKGKLLDKKYTDLVNKTFFEDMFMFIHNRRKVGLFCFNKYVYYYVNRISKFGK